jgi:hypothetical protein
MIYGLLVSRDGGSRRTTRLSSNTFWLTGFIARLTGTLNRKCQRFGQSTVIAILRFMVIYGIRRLTVKQGHVWPYMAQRPYRKM